MKILFVTDNFPPETNAPASRTYEHCIEWINEGAEVTVITCFPNFPKGKIYPGYKNSFRKEENLNGIKVIRVWSYIYSNSGFLLRIIDHLSFAFLAIINLIFIKKKSYDVIIATSPQFFVGITAMLISKFKKIPWYFEVRDLWPEGIILINNNGLVYKFLEKLEKLYYNSSSGVITVTNSFKSNIIERFNINNNKIEVVFNGSNNCLFKPRKKSLRLIDSLGLKNKFIIGYAGTIGVSHALDFILDCCHDIYIYNKEIHFLFIGSGSEYDKIKSMIKKMNLHNVTLLPAVSKSQIPEYLSIFDCGLVNLKKFHGYKKVIPSKIFELASLRKPILLGVDGESRSIINKYNAGFYFEPENKIEFIENCKKIFTYDPHYFNKGLVRLSNDFDRKYLAKKMYNFIKK